MMIFLFWYVLIGSIMYIAASYMPDFTVRRKFMDSTILLTLPLVIPGLLVSIILYLSGRINFDLAVIMRISGMNKEERYSTPEYRNLSNELEIPTCFWSGIIGFLISLSLLPLI
jgi:hypothetical protein